MKKFTILVDLDSIAVDTLGPWLQRIAEKFGVVARVSDVTDWTMNRCPPLDKLSMEQIIGVLDEPDFTLSLAPMSGAVENLKRLHDAGHTLYFITARWGSNCMPETLAWMRRHLPWVNAEKRLGFLSDKWMIPADILIDDRAETLTKYHAAHPKAHLLTIDYPYNQKAPADVYRVSYGNDAWLQMCQIIEVLAEVADEHLS
jgi:5'(3')-deoxyribonucleotidase